MLTSCFACFGWIVCLLALTFSCGIPLLRLPHKGVENNLFVQEICLFHAVISFLCCCQHIPTGLSHRCKSVCGVLRNECCTLSKGHLTSRTRRVDRKTDLVDPTLQPKQCHSRAISGKHHNHWWSRALIMFMLAVPIHCVHHAPCLWEFGTLR